MLSLSQQMDLNLNIPEVWKYRTQIAAWPLLRVFSKHILPRAEPPLQQVISPEDSPSGTADGGISPRREQSEKQRLGLGKKWKGVRGRAEGKQSGSKPVGVKPGVPGLQLAAGRGWWAPVLELLLLPIPRLPSPAHIRTKDVHSHNIYLQVKHSSVCMCVHRGCEWVELRIHNWGK